MTNMPMAVQSNFDNSYPRSFCRLCGAPHEAPNPCHEPEGKRGAAAHAVEHVTRQRGLPSVIPDMHSLFRLHAQSLQSSFKYHRIWLLRPHLCMGTFSICQLILKAR